MAPPVIPPEAEERIRDLLKRGALFHVELDGKEGRVLAWKVTEFGKSEYGRADRALDNKTGRPAQ